MGKRAPCGCERIGGGWNISECECPLRKGSLEVYQRMCGVLVINGVTGAIISDFHPPQPVVSEELRDVARMRARPTPPSPVLESFDEATRGGPWTTSPPSTVGRETFAELLEELEVSVGKTKPTEAEWLRRICSIVWQNAHRTWVTNARGDVWEITDRLRPTFPTKPAALSTHLFPAPAMRFPLVPQLPPALVMNRQPADDAILDHLCSFVCEQDDRKWVVGPRGSIEEFTGRAVPRPLGGTLTLAPSLAMAPTLLAPTLPAPAEAAHAA
ncbi:MAG: hypothetical protein KGJ23_11195 [Euryarchaeota archaeon]|nr:hypothetical protein [Euryarchaeota archaeon]MDE1837159.1 hypothetical protein [Euryarchaeota archaeon]MDE1881503.1 hypothetical protein [Euryarchaeota archaeon]MDE2046336.1 hypothetical protein [Thermoplasmata archaeon]